MKLVNSDIGSETLFMNGLWFARFRVPWKTEVFVRNTETKEQKPFGTKAEAAQAGADAVYSYLANKTTGFIASPQAVDPEAAEVFRKFK